MAITFTWDFNTDTVTGARLQTSLDELAAGQSAIGPNDIAPAAGIPQSKLGTITGTIQVEYTFSIHNVTGGWPASGTIVGAGQPISQSTWTVIAYRYVVNDTTTVPASTFRIEYGYYDSVTGAWTQQTVIATGIAMTALGGATPAVGSATLSPSVALNTVKTAPGCIAVISESAAVAALLADGQMHVTLLLQRNVSL